MLRHYPLYHFHHPFPAPYRPPRLLAGWKREVRAREGLRVGAEGVSGCACRAGLVMGEDGGACVGEERRVVAQTPFEQPQ